MCRSYIVLLLLAVLIAASLSTPSQAQPTGAVSELVELRSATSKTWLNEDGSRVASILPVPIHYLDSTGIWQDIDTNLATATKDGFSYSVVRNWFKTYFTENARGWNAIEFDSIIFRFTTDSSQSLECTADSNKITYSDAWLGVDLKYQVTSTGIKEDIILKQKPSVNQFRFLVNPGGLKPVTIGRGIDFIDAEGKTRVRIPGPFMHDVNGEFSDAVEATWSSLPDGTVELVIQPDEELLSQAVYPVVIDPTTDVIAPYEGTGKDSYYDIWLRTGTGTRYDTTTQLSFGKNTGTQRDYSTCIKWDTSSIPDNAVISPVGQGDTRIELYSYNAPGIAYSVGIKEITNTWPSTTLPARGSTLETISWSSPDGYKYFSNTAVRDLIQKWIWGSNNYGVEIDETTGTSILLKCWAGEYEPPLPPPGGYSDPPIYAPRLTATYDQDTTDPGIADSSPYVSIGSITVNYSGAVDTGDIQSGLKLVELWYKKGPTGVWTYTGSYGTEPSGSFPFEATEEDTYYFDLVAEDNAGNRSADASGEGDTQTIYNTAFEQSELNPTGRVAVNMEYLYPGGPNLRTSVHDSSGNRVRSTTWNYGLAGEVVSVYGSAEPAIYTYDSLYRLKSITDGNSNVTTYTYDEVGNVSQVELGGTGGDVVQYPEYDPAGRVLNTIKPDGTVVRYLYVDKEGLLTKIIYPDTPALNVNFTYDTAYGRLTEVTDSSGVRTFSYDHYDAPISETTTYTGLSGRTVGYQFYPDGSLQKITVSTLGDFDYAYDEVGRLVGLTNPLSQAFSWSYFDNNWLETQITPVSDTTYDYSTRGLLTSLTNRKTDQTLLSQFTMPYNTAYDAFGNLLYGSATYPFGYAAQYAYHTDQETGLQLLTHRYYDPYEGRFLTRDPIGYVGGINLYTYVENNPVNITDPLGLCEEPTSIWGQLNPFNKNSALFRQGISIYDFYRGDWKSAAANSGWAMM